MNSGTPLRHQYSRDFFPDDTVLEFPPDNGGNPAYDLSARGSNYRMITLLQLALLPFHLHLQTAMNSTATHPAADLLRSTLQDSIDPVASTIPMAQLGLSGPQSRIDLTDPVAINPCAATSRTTTRKILGATLSPLQEFPIAANPLTAMRRVVSLVGLTPTPTATLLP